VHLLKNNRTLIGIDKNVGILNRIIWQRQGLLLTACE